MELATGNTALVLMGGGAHAAYQVGALDAVQQILIDANGTPSRIPYSLVCGTSAGAINAAALACGAGDPQAALATMVDTWSGLHAGDVYRSDVRGALGNAARWLGALTTGWATRQHPRSLFDTRPLEQLLARLVDPARIDAALQAGQLRALAITASSYSSGRHVTFYQSSEPIEPWTRAHRLSYPATITIAHLLASSAIPFLFPAARLEIEGRHEYFGDGSMGQVVPLSPAIHLGARRILVVGAWPPEDQAPIRPRAASQDPSQDHYPSLAQIAGHALGSMFLDGLSYDLERVARLNRILRLIPESRLGASPLRPIEVLAITPSRSLDELAAGMIKILPRTIRATLRVSGAADRHSVGLLSYLLFESAYTGQLVELGRSDTLARRPEVLEFFGLV